MTDESERIGRLVAGSQRAFTELYNAYWQQVYRFARLYLSDSDAARELTQEVFLKVWEARETLSPEADFSGWLFIVTRNFVFSRFRKQVNEEFYRINILSAMERSYDMEGDIEAADLRTYIDSLVEQMPARRREIFNLSRREQLTYKEIAVRMNLSERAVEKQIGEALRFLREHLELWLMWLAA